MAAVKGLLGLPAFLAGVAALFWWVGGQSGAGLQLDDRPAFSCERWRRGRDTPADRRRRSVPPLGPWLPCRVFQGAALTGFLKWWRFGPRNDVEAA